MTGGAHLKTRRTAAGLLKKGPAQKEDRPRRIGRAKGGLNPKRHAAAGQDGEPVILLRSEGQMNGQTSGHDERPGARASPGTACPPRTP